MNDLSIRAGALITVIAILVAYNVTVEMRTKDAEIAMLSAKLEAANEASLQSAEEDAAESGFADGVYTGAFKGYGDLINVELSVEGGRISDIKILSAPGEDAAYLSMAESLIPVMIERQTTSVDVVTGATMSSTGLINAAGMALNQAISGGEGQE